MTDKHKNYKMHTRINGTLFHKDFSSLLFINKDLSC